MQVRGGWKRAIFEDVRQQVHSDNLPRAAEHSGGAHQGRPRPRRQGDRPPQRRRIRVEHRRPFRRQLPLRHPYPNGQHRQVPPRQRRASHHQYLPFPQPLRRFPLPRRLRLLRRRLRRPRRRRVHHLHQRLRRQLRHPRLRLREERPRLDPGHRRRDRLAHRRRRQRQPPARSPLQPGLAPSHQRAARHAEAADGAAGDLHVLPPRRGLEERRSRQLRAALGGFLLRRHRQVPARPRRREEPDGGEGGEVHGAAVVRDGPRRRPRRPGGAGGAELRMHLRRLHQPRVRIVVRWARRAGERVVRIQHVLPDDEPAERRV